jgi:hypothetical protein
MGDYTEFGALKYDPQEISSRGYGVASSGPGDERLIVLFYNKSVLNVARSKAEGKRIFESKEFVKIQQPGETLNIVDRPVLDGDRQRFPRQWERFAQGKTQIPDGIPISLLFPAQPNISDMLAGYQVHTIEQLANLSGHAIATIGMGAQEWVNKAAKYLEQANKGVDFHRFEKAIEEKDKQIATLTRQVSDMQRQVDRFMAKLPDRPDSSFDVQSSQIAAAKLQEVLAPEPTQFSADIINMPVIPKRRGRPPGSRNKPKE